MNYLYIFILIFVILIVSFYTQYTYDSVNINIEPLLKAFSKFEQFRINSTTEQEKAGTIQAFEYCFELVWKIMKRLLEERGKIANSPKETFRIAALEGFISDPEIWFDFLRKRNLTVHTYQESEADNIIAITESFSFEIKQFLQKIGFVNDKIAVLLNQQNSEDNSASGEEPINNWHYNYKPIPSKNEVFAIEREYYKLDKHVETITLNYNSQSMKFE